MSQGQSRDPNPSSPVKQSKKTPPKCHDSQIANNKSAHRSNLKNNQNKDGKIRTHIEPGCAAPDVIPLGDVVQSRRASTVEQWVEEAERRLARSEHRVVQERDDGRKGRRRGGSPADQRGVPLEIGEEVSRLRRDVRICLCIKDIADARVNNQLLSPEGRWRRTRPALYHTIWTRKPSRWHG